MGHAPAAADRGAREPQVTPLRQRDGHASPTKRDPRSLAAATDEVRRRFGNDAIAYGRDLRLRGEESDTVPKNKS